ncbi:MAG: DNA phosphorothioation-dependent restriction protein DptG [Sulfuricurvum sp.]|nr:DNA phosphorothioation-dependent restriction protein DptG [Sulfuricurvum sp.]
MLIDKLKAINVNHIHKDNKTAPKYFPLTTNENANIQNAFDTNDLTGQLVGLKFNKQLAKDFSSEDFIEKVLIHFEEKIDKKKHVEIVKNIYFAKDKLTPLTPLMYLSTPKIDTKTKKAFSLFSQMLQPVETSISQTQQLNFIEQDIFNLFNTYTIDKKHDLQTSSYIEFLDDTFTQDFNYLLKNQHYFHAQIDRFLKFYMFTYSSQLALNLHDNAIEKPSPQKVYFILNHEKASSERKNLTNHGYKLLAAKVRNLFPYLSLLENLSTVIEDESLKYFNFKDIELSEDNVKALDDLRRSYRQAKSMIADLSLSSSIKDALQNLLNTTVEQFRTDKKAVLDRFLTAFENQIARFFFQVRGRSGKVLVMDQDTILLLTNLSIADKLHLRFQDLIAEFKDRGVYFDAKSQDALLELFERVGNIDRKSDSGDAVYVKPTI